MDKVYTELRFKLGYVVSPGLSKDILAKDIYFKHAVVTKKHSKRFPAEMWTKHLAKSSQAQVLVMPEKDPSCGLFSHKRDKLASGETIICTETASNWEVATKSELSLKADRNAPVQLLLLSSFIQPKGVLTLK